MERRYRVAKADGMVTAAQRIAWQRPCRSARPPHPATQGCPMTFRNGLSSLLRPEDSVLVLIDHQPYQLANLNSHDPHAVVNNATALAKAA